jgi:hypothetical protein
MCYWHFIHLFVKFLLNLITLCKSNYENELKIYVITLMCYYLYLSKDFYGWLKVQYSDYIIYIYGDELFWAYSFQHQQPINVPSPYQHPVPCPFSLSTSTAYYCPLCWGTGFPYELHIRKARSQCGLVLTTANAAGTNGLTCLLKHFFSVTDAISCPIQSSSKLLLVSIVLMYSFQFVYEEINFGVVKAEISAWCLFRSTFLIL